MKNLKKYGISVAITGSFIIILNFIISILSYFNILNNKLIDLFIVIIPIIGVVLGGINIGRQSVCKGWLSGLKIGLLYLCISVLLKLLLSNSFKLYYLFYSLILVLSSVIGGMLGISMKKNDISPTS